MGSGRGQAKRVQAVTSTQAAPRTQEQRKQLAAARWAEFLQGAQLEDMNISRYYNAPELNRDKVGEKQLRAAQSRVAKELFDDLVEMGAIHLPRSLEVSDIDFAVKGWQERNWPDAVIRLVACNLKSGKEVEASGIYGALNHDTPLGHIVTANFVSDLATAVPRVARR